MYKITSTMTNLNYCRINVRGYFSVLDNSYFTKTSNAQCPLSQNESCETYALYRDLGRIDPYACAIKVKNVFYDVWDTVGHIPREISRHTYFFLTEEGGQVCGTVMSVVYRSSPIPGGGLEIPLNLTFKCNEATTVIKMKNFVREMYDYNYLEKMVDDDEDDLCTDVTTLLPMLPLCYHFVTTLLPLCYRCYHFVTTLLPMLPLCYHFVTTLLPLCYRCYHFVTTLLPMLPLCYHFVITLLLLLRQ